MSADGTPFPVEIDVIVEVPAWRKAVRDVEAVCDRAAGATLTAGLPDSALGGLLAAGQRFEVCVALEDDASVRALNHGFRNQDKPTNVLAFAALEDENGRVLVPPADLGEDDEDEPTFLGDIVIALETTRDEAARDAKPLADHLSHLVVHGVLHLLGHDHQDEDEAQRMEDLETRILAGMGIPDPHAAPPESGTEDNERTEPK
ncbi:rRNA maturation RNase YbeY [Rhodospira trueperi]|uniref:Endoribonuclease YbeY n=1 Tax=Rhodospira trueperi TaxID=69960 RepID=A0A1G6XSF6_9PROT|nr:rRNA maturation RNase YbeY [Rhodospira trueperi]SDD80901.1 probable rRNA maturation factor [Rhodospira trueperi]